MAGELRVAIGVHDTMSVALTHKHYIDGSTTKHGNLTVELRNASGAPVMFEGKQVYVSERGQRLLGEWRQRDNLDTGIDMAVYKETMMTNLADNIMGRKEEDH